MNIFDSQTLPYVVVKEDYYLYWAERRNNNGGLFGEKHLFSCHSLHYSPIVVQLERRKKEYIYKKHEEMGERIGFFQKCLYIFKIFLLFIFIEIIKPEQNKSILKPESQVSIGCKTSLGILSPYCICLFSRDGFECNNNSYSEGRYYIDKEINISQCFFSISYVFSGNGGIICVSGGTFSMRVIFSMFFNCSCTNNGGAIFFSSSNSNLRMICTNKCTCGSDSCGHFADLFASHLNLVEFLSVSLCSPTANGFYSLWLEFGNQKVDNINSSKNNAKHYSGICIQPSYLFTSFYCTFSNNSVSQSKCLLFHSKPGRVAFANIVHNNSPSLGVVYIYGGGSPKLISCILHSNQRTLFCVWSGSLVVSHSFIYHLGEFSYGTPLSTDTNNSFVLKQTYFIEYSGSQLCVIPTQTPKTSKNSHLVWIMYSTTLVIMITLLVLLFIYRRIAVNLRLIHGLEDELLVEYG